MFTVGINRAVTLLAEKKTRGGNRAGPAPLKELGEHPDLGGPIQVMSGRYGPYVKHGKVNATLPRDIKPETVTMEQAVELIAAKASKPGKAKPAKAKSAAKKKPAAKAAKKAAPTKKTKASEDA